MKFRLTTPIWKVCTILIGSAALVFSFQNCGKAGFDSGLDEGLAQSSTDPELDQQFGKSDAEKVAAIPFAYDLIVDQIAYNSCSGANVPSTPGFFTFKLGSYTSKGGLKLREDFVTYVNKNFKAVSPAMYLSDLQIKNFLAASPENKAAQPQFAIRGRGNPQQVRSSNTTLNENVDYFNLLGDLTNDRFMDPLVQSMVAMQGNSNPVYVPTQFFPFAVSSIQRTVETSISFNSNEAIAQALRNDFGRNAQLAMTYTSKEIGDPYVARTPIDSTDTNAAYGRAYIPVFAIAAAPYTLQADYSAMNPPVMVPPITPKAATGCPGGSCQPAWSTPNNIMTGISEVNLEGSAVGTGATWNCNPKRRYVIIKASDSKACPKESYAAIQGGITGAGVIPAISAQDYQTELEIVRRSLPAEDWDVNIQLRCAVPKTNTSTCYPDEVINGVSVSVEYDQTVECFQGLNTQNFLTPATPPTKRCAQYVSICTRN